jgi:hypothetical protein
MISDVGFMICSYNQKSAIINQKCQPRILGRSARIFSKRAGAKKSRSLTLRTTTNGGSATPDTYILGARGSDEPQKMAQN